AGAPVESAGARDLTAPARRARGSELLPRALAVPAAAGPDLQALLPAPGQRAVGLGRRAPRARRDPGAVQGELLRADRPRDRGAGFELHLARRDAARGVTRGRVRGGP